MADETRQDSPELRDSQPKPKRKATDKQRAAGRENLKRFNQSRGGKPNVRHGIQSFIATGAAPTAIETRLDAFEEGLVKDLGGSPSTSEIALIQSARTCLGVCLMADAFVQQGGLANFRKNRWVLTVTATYSNTLRLNLQAINVKSSVDATRLVDDLATRRKKSSLNSVIAATEEPTTLPSWYDKSKDCEDVG
jgi:hypothetical protein